MLLSLLGVNSLILYASITLAYITTVDLWLVVYFGLYPFIHFKGKYHFTYVEALDHV